MTIFDGYIIEKKLKSFMIIEKARFEHLFSLTDLYISSSFKLNVGFDCSNQT